MSRAIPATAVKYSIVREGEKFTPPLRSKPGDAGADLTCSQNVFIAPNQRAMVTTNIAVEIPEGHFGLLLPRSSAFYRKGLVVHPGTIDPTYRGELRILVWNVAPKAVYLGEGDSIAQLVIVPYVEVTFIDRPLTVTERGENAFGSTGRVPGETPVQNLQP